MMKALLLFVVLDSLACPGLAKENPDTSGRRIPLIYCSDLFHPHDDPDDHFDLATVFAIPEFDIRCIILDLGKLQEKRPGKVPVSQMNRITGRRVPTVIGLGEKLRQPTDQALDQPPQFQQGVTSIVSVLRTSTTPVMIITVGSVRDVAAAFNREPELFRAKVGKIMVFIGDASAQDYGDWNVQLDPQAYVGMMRSGLPIYWVPCFDGGIWQNKGHASFWRASHGDVLGQVRPAVLQYFIYAMEEETAEPLSFLTQPVDAAKRERLLAGKRNFWCAAVFGSLAGRDLVREHGRYVSKPRWPGKPLDRSLRNELFEFEEVEVQVTDNAAVNYGPQPDAHKVMRFTIRDQTNYARGMTEATASLLDSLGKTMADATASD